MLIRATATLATTSIAGLLASVFAARETAILFAQIPATPTPETAWYRLLEFWGPAAVLLLAAYRAGVWLAKKLFDEPNGLIVRLVGSHIGFIDATNTRLERIEDQQDSIQQTQGKIALTQEKIADTQQKLLETGGVKVEKLAMISQSNAEVLLKLTEIKDALKSAKKE